MRKLIAILFLIIAVSVSASATVCTNYTFINGSNTITIFNATGTCDYQIPTGVTLLKEAAVIAGGASGGGGNYIAAGAGAGGVNDSFGISVVPGNLINVSIGDGGVGATPSGPGNNGGDSYFRTPATNVSARHGGRGGQYNGILPNDGGSGGGAAYPISNGASGLAGQGYRGGNFTNNAFSSGAAGGSCGGPGGDNTATFGGNSSNGCYLPNFSTYAGSPGGWFASGGAGAGQNGVASPGKAGLGGGTDGSTGASNNAVNNTGGGSGGAERLGAATSGKGGSGIIMVIYGTPGAVTPITASFTQSPNPSSTGKAVTFTDTSTGSPTTWNWTFGDIGGSNTSTTQNPSHTYSTYGTYPVLLNVTNATGSFSTVTHNQVVTNATGFTQQDIWMTAQYTLAIHVLDASDGSIIPDATMVDSGTGATYATTNGTIYATYPFQAVAGVISATDYDAKGFSVFVDNDTSTTVQLTEATKTSQNANVVYQAQLYRFLFSNLIGTPLGGLQVKITPLNLTMQSNWTTLLMGMSPEINITNGVISGITGRDGSFGTPLINPLYYQVTITGTAQSGDIVNQIFTEYPPPVGGDILIQIPTSVTGFRTIIPQQANITYNIYNVTVNSSTSILSVNFNDPTGATNLTVVTITNQSGYVLNKTSYSGAAADNVVNNFTYTQGVTSPAGDILSYGFSAYIPGSGGWNNISQPIDFNTGTSLTGNATYDGWLSIIIIVLVASAFTYSSVYIGTIGVGLMGLFFYYTVKWFTPAVSGTVFVAACVFWICIGVIGFIAKRSRKVD